MAVKIHVGADEKQKIIKCDWTCENRACGHMRFVYFFKLSSLITFYTIKLLQSNFSALDKQVYDASYRMQIFCSSAIICCVTAGCSLLPTCKKCPIFTGLVLLTTKTILHLEYLHHIIVTHEIDHLLAHVILYHVQCWE